MSYKDDYGDVWTTSAVTTYYQALTPGGSLIVGPSDTVNKLTSTPFFIDPAYRGPSFKVVNVDGGLQVANSPEGLGIASVYSEAFSYEQSFIGEQVNASIQALPNDLVRHAYVHTVYNYASDADKVFIYPSMGVPKFGDLNGQTLADTYSAGAGVCSADSSTLSADDFANIGNFADGKSKAVNDARYRFPYFVAPDDPTEGINDLTEAYTNCGRNNLCIFITIPEPVGMKELTVNYKFKALIRTVIAAAEVELKPEEYYDSLARERSNHNGDVNSIVSVTEVGSSRHWHKLIDGTPDITFRSDQGLHECSRRGLCDYETGECKCFDGYSGYRCRDRSVLGL